MKDRILITGGMGFVGGRVAQSLSAAFPTAEIVIGSRVIRESPSWLPNAQVVQIDWHSLKSLISACDGVNTLVHLAGLSDIDCLNNPILALEINALNTARLIQAARKTGVKRVIYFSTAHVYSNNLVGDIDERTLPKGRSPYATSHLAAESLVLAAADAGIGAVVLRLSNSFGVPAHSEVNAWRLLINDLCRQAVMSRRLTLRSRGLQRRDFVTLKDVSRVVFHMTNLSNDQIGDGLFNVGSGKSERVIDMARLVQARCAKILEYHPVIIRPEHVETDESPELNFHIEKLLSTGFRLGNSAVLEIDETLRMCQRCFN